MFICAMQEQEFEIDFITQNSFPAPEVISRYI
jgi:hypothetical protein